MNDARKTKLSSANSRNPSIVTRTISVGLANKNASVSYSNSYQ